MSTDRDTTRAVRSWLEEGVTALPDRVLDGVLDQLPATRQRRGLWRGLTLGNVSARARLAMSAAAIVAVVLVGIGLVPSLTGPIRPGATGPSPSPSPVPTVEPSPTEPIATQLPPGSYSLEGFPIGVSFTVAEGWARCGEGPLEQGVCRLNGDGALNFLIVTDVVADTCADARLDPPPGPSVDELVAAISALPGFTATTPTDVNVDGFAGKKFTVTAPDGPCTNPRTWATANRINGVGPGEVNLIRIVDVNGTRVVMTGALGPIEADSPEAVARLEQVMDTVTFTP